MLYIVIEYHRYENEIEWHSTDLPEGIFDDHSLAVSYIKNQAKGHEIIREEQCLDGWYMLDFIIHHDTFSNDYDKLIRYQIPGTTWEVNKPW